MKKATEQQVINLFVQAMRTALALIDDKAYRTSRATKSALPTGIYPAQSKYNPYRAYEWNGRKPIYLGMFPSLAAAKRAQKAYRTGRQPQDGTRVANRRAPLTLVRKEA